MIEINKNKIKLCFRIKVRNLLLIPVELNPIHNNKQ